MPIVSQLSIIINQEQYTYNSYITNIAEDNITFIVEFDVVGPNKPRKHSLTMTNAENVEDFTFSENDAYTKLFQSIPDNSEGVAKMKAKAIAGRIQFLINALPNVIDADKEACRVLFDTLWEGLDMEHSQQILDALGDQATGLFMKHAAWQDLLETVGSSYVRLIPPYNVEFNPNGKISLKEKTK